MGVKDIEITLPKANSQMHKKASMASYFCCCSPPLRKIQYSSTYFISVACGLSEI